MAKRKDFIWNLFHPTPDSYSTKKAIPKVVEIEGCHLCSFEATARQGIDARAGRMLYSSPGNCQIEKSFFMQNLFALYPGNGLPAMPRPGKVQEINITDNLKKLATFWLEYCVTAVLPPSPYNRTKYFPITY